MLLPTTTFFALKILVRRCACICAPHECARKKCGLCSPRVGECLPTTNSGHKFQGSRSSLVERRPRRRKQNAHVIFRKSIVILKELSLLLDELRCVLEYFSKIGSPPTQFVVPSDRVKKGAYLAAPSPLSWSFPLLCTMIRRHSACSICSLAHEKQHIHTTASKKERMKTFHQPLGLVFRRGTTYFIRINPREKKGQTTLFKGNAKSKLASQQF